MSQSSGGSSDHPEEEWSLITETREWKAVTDPSRCERIARKLGKRIAEIKRVNSRDLPYICIFEDKEDKES